ncbi:hypothetical protein RHECNPAF_12210038 [Rhizobium etli CNPAF512]|nr:hypothetical protein RHECNPAF_12210038 [Rhizobium etli CNPAF512]
MPLLVIGSSPKIFQQSKNIIRCQTI